jgi:hypothetical protein
MGLLAWLSDLHARTEPLPKNLFPTTRFFGVGFLADSWGNPDLSSRGPLYPGGGFVPF